ncbi:unnamed protein product, partial [Cylicocyclus nassatus]
MPNKSLERKEVDRQKRVCAHIFFCFYNFCFHLISGQNAFISFSFVSLYNFFPISSRTSHAMFYITKLKFTCEGT